MITLVLLLLFLIVAGAVWFQGLWGNALNLINMLLAGFVATSFFEPLSNLLVGWLPSYTYLLDFLVLWLLFAVSYGLLRLFTDLISRERVRFIMPVEMAGRSVLAILVAWVFICFTAATLHTAPLPATPFGGAFSSPSARSFLVASPDRIWWNMIQFRSTGALSGNPFAADDFLVKYHQRRVNFEGTEAFLANQ